VRNQLDHVTLVELFGWDEDEFKRKLEGSPIRRIGIEAWLRNIAVALGNAARAGARGDGAIVAALWARLDYPSELVQEHVAWALAQHTGLQD
jgi:epoxyqueuosine reductase